MPSGTQQPPLPQCASPQQRRKRRAFRALQASPAACKSIRHQTSAPDAQALAQQPSWPILGRATGSRSRFRGWRRHLCACCDARSGLFAVLSGDLGRLLSHSCGARASAVSWSWLQLHSTPATSVAHDLDWYKWLGNTQHAPVCVTQHQVVLGRDVGVHGRGRPLAKVGFVDNLVFLSTICTRVIYT